MLVHSIKILLLALYASALAGLAGLLPSSLANPIEMIAVALLLIHALECLLMFKHVRRYPGSLAVSVLLTLLFGLLHWKPLAAQHAKNS